MASGWLILKHAPGLIFWQVKLSVDKVREGLPQWLSSKIIYLQNSRLRRHGFDTWVRKIPWRREWLPAPVFLPGKFYGQRTLVGYSPWDHRVRHNWATNTHTHTHTHTHTQVFLMMSNFCKKGNANFILKFLCILLIR